MSAKQNRRRRLEAYAQQPYVKRLDEALRAGAFAGPPGRVGMVEVRHDDWCGIWKGGACNCEPELAVRYQPTSGGVA